MMTKQERERYRELATSPALRDKRLHQRLVKEMAVKLSIAICERNKPGLHPEMRYGLAVANQMVRQHFGLDAYGRAK